MPTKTNVRRALRSTKTTGRSATKKITPANAERKGKKGEEINLRDLLVEKLRLLYDVEGQIVKGLPKLAKKAADADLQDAMNHHLRQTEVQARRLEEAMGVLGMKPQKGRSLTMRGLSDDAEAAVKAAGKGATADAALIAALRAVEHYEIAEYGALHEWAELLGERQIADLIEETLHEEEETADALMDLAISKANAKAAGEPVSGEGPPSGTQIVFDGGAVIAGAPLQTETLESGNDSEADAEADKEEDDEEEEEKADEDDEEE